MQRRRQRAQKPRAVQQRQHVQLQVAGKRQQVIQTLLHRSCAAGGLDKKRVGHPVAVVAASPQKVWNGQQQKQTGGL